MDVSRKRRCIGFFFNLITMQGLIVGNLFLLITSGRTIGGMAAGYKYQHGGIKILFLLASKAFAIFLYLITISIFFWIDFLKMEDRNGTFAEKWSDNRKTNHR